MNYENCKPIESCLCTAWLIKFDNGDKHIAIWHKDAFITDVQEAIKNQYSGRKFTVLRIDVGDFLIRESHVNHYLSGDGRMINQDKIMEI